MREASFAWPERVNSPREGIMPPRPKRRTQARRSRSISDWTLLLGAGRLVRVARRAGRRLAARVGIVPPAQDDSSDWLTASRSHSDAGRVGHCLHYEECRPTCQGAMIRFLWSVRPYFRQV